MLFNIGVILNAVSVVLMALYIDYQSNNKLSYEMQSPSLFRYFYTTI